MSLSANTMPDFELRQLVKQLTEERDQARARVAELENIDALEAKIAPIIAVAEARGFERGVRQAAKACDWGDIYGDNAVKSILALLEKPSLSMEDKPT
jgi:hypothetical protein